VCVCAAQLSPVGRALELQRQRLFYDPVVDLQQNHGSGRWAGGERGFTVATVEPIAYGAPNCAIFSDGFSFLPGFRLSLPRTRRSGPATRACPRRACNAGC